MIAFPVKALLRNKTIANLKARVNLGKDFDPDIYIVGQTQDEPCEMWLKKGCWRYNATPHPLDIVGFPNADGSFRPLTNELT